METGAAVFFLDDKNKPATTKSGKKKLQFELKKLMGFFLLKTETKKNHLPSDGGPHLTFESLTKEVILLFDQESDEEDCYMERRKVLILMFEGFSQEDKR